MSSVNANRVRALVTRHLLSWPRSLERVADAFWWPTMNLLIWGLVNRYLEQQSGTANNFLALFLGGMIMWTVVVRSQEEMGLLFLQEAWDRNLLNIFSSPITLAEFSAATIVLGLIKLLMTFVWMVLISSLLFAFNIFTLGWLIVPYALLLLLSGWSLGFFINGLIVMYGYRVQVFAWTLTMLILPFSSVYYPVSALPMWMQPVARAIPVTYVFEGMRRVFSGGGWDVQGMLVSLLLNLVYLLLSIRFFHYSYRKAQQSGMIMKFS